MKTTFEELNRMFKLNDPQHRRIKAGLHNKIVITTDEGVMVKDEELQYILSEFRKDGTYTLNEVCKMYNVKKDTVKAMIKTNMVSAFQLFSSKGSQYLFLKSDLKKEHQVLLRRVTKADVLKWAVLGEKILSKLRDSDFFSEREYSVFKEYFFQDMNYEEIGRTQQLTPERVRHIIEKIKRRLGYLTLRALKDRAEMTEFWKRYRALEAKCAEQEVILNDIAQLKKYMNGNPNLNKEYSQYRLIPLKDMGFSKRTLNCFAAADIETLEDVLLAKKKGLLPKLRNFGKKSEGEVERMIRSMGIK